MKKIIRTIKPVIFLLAVILIAAYRAPVQETTPIGTVIHSIMPPSYFLENHKNWVLLEGQKFTPNSVVYKSQLYQSLLSHPIGNMDSLPDSRGMFLRSSNYNGGVDVDSTRILGHPQSDATKLSNNPMTGVGIAKSDKNSQHTHTVRYQTYAKRLKFWVKNTGKEVDLAMGDGSVGGGEHSHSVNISLEGGDNETRPKNISLYTYIKIN